MMGSLKTYEFFIYVTFHLVFLNHDYPWVTETTENETSEKRDCCICPHLKAITLEIRIISLKVCFLFTYFHMVLMNKSPSNIF
jgi:hypothetical protein